jgi:hypothetical protein
MIHSSTLQHTEVKEISLQFPGPDLAPYLNKGVTLAVLQSSGTLHIPRSV